MQQTSDKPVRWWTRLITRVTKAWDYGSSGVWDDPRDNWKVNTVKTVNLTVRSFFDSDLQSSACAMTYRTLLALVPALALVFAIARGFGFQNILNDEMSHLTQGQEQVAQAVTNFVDSYLSQASQGIFVGVGIIFLLFTLVMLLSSVEEAFNKVWGVEDKRSWWRKIADYTAILIILPVLLICSSGLSILMSSAVHALLPFDFLGPVAEFIIGAMSWVLTWLFFAGSFILIPNTKVKLIPALIAGVIAGSAYRLITWLFLSGQLYVTKYNAIYGSFSFLPLLLVWMQLTWLVTLTGALICSSAQNIYRFNMGDRIKNISYDYAQAVSLMAMTVIVKRFVAGEKPLNIQSLAVEAELPQGLASLAVTRLKAAGLVVEIESQFADKPVQPSRGAAFYTAGNVLMTLRRNGQSNFVKGFDQRYHQFAAMLDDIEKNLTSNFTKPLSEITLTDTKQSKQ